MVGGASGAASSSPTASRSPSAPSSPDDDGPDLVAVPADAEVRVPWIEPGWLVVPLVLVPVLAAAGLLLLRRLVWPAGRHRRL